MKVPQSMLLRRWLPFGRSGSATEKQMKLKRHDFKSKIVKMSIQVDANKLKSTNALQQFESPLQKGIAKFSARTCAALQRATNKDFLSDGSFQEAVGSVLAMAQFFAIMPLRGVKSRDVNDLQFTWRSVRTVYTVVAFGLTCINILLCLMSLYHGDIEFTRIMVFYVTTGFSMLSFCNLGRKWPAIMRQWQRVEHEMPPLPTQFAKRALSHRIRMLALVVMLLSLLEHLLNIITSVHNANKCKHTADPIENVMLVQLSHIFLYTKYSTTKAIVGKASNIICTFIWTYTDLFVMVISVSLASRFRQINDSLREHKGKAMPESFWLQHRIYYRSICDLCMTIDRAMGHITLVSFSNNLWFICIQLLFSLNKQPSIAHALYYWYSLVFLVARTLAVSLCSAEINDESKEPLKVFRSVPPESWCLEIKRFSNEVSRDVIALSGMRFFHLTRGLVLSVAGTIITYELVLVQFHTGEYNKGECFLQVQV